MNTRTRHLYQSWLNHQCGMLSGLHRAAVLCDVPETRQLGSVAAWPDDADLTPELSNVAVMALRRRRVIIQGHADRALLACPLLQGDEVLGVAALEMEPRTDAQLRTIARAVRLGSAWLELLMGESGATEAVDAVAVVELVATGLEHDQFRAAANSVMTELAARLSCDRVSLGFVRRGHTRVEVMSGSASIDHRTGLGVSVAAAMDEALDQDTSIALPLNRDEQFQVTQAHESLTAQFGCPGLCTIPISHDGRLVGAVTLEHADADRFDGDTVGLCETIVSLVGPILYDKHRRERPVLAKAAEKSRTPLQKLFGPRHSGFKLVAAVSAAVCAVLFLVEGQYRITAHASLEGTVQRVVVAPVGGYIAEAPARAGDIVAAGDVLARLEDKDLKLERLKLASEKTQLQQEYREAMAQLDSARVSILQAQLDRATAQLALTEENLKRTRIKAPLSGIIVSGDLSQSLGVPVERGDYLFEVAPLDSYRVMLQVDEREIGRLDPGQIGRLALVGFPGEYLAFTVARITPVSTASDGKNVFAVEAQLARTPDLLRPGMQGVAKIDIGERRLAWIWSHRLVDWLRLWTWTWLPWS